MKLFKIISAFLAAASGMALAPAFADSVTINCPLTQARREIVTAIPSDWWNTPLLVSLSGVEVTEIGGVPSLVCKYGAAGTVQRHAPEGASCAPSGTGFVCETAGDLPEPPAENGVLYSGTITLPIFGMVDLDEGAGGLPNMDLTHLVSDGLAAVITPQNGARFSAGFSEEPEYGTCTSASMKKKPVVLTGLIGGYLCYKTDQGHVGVMEFISLSGGNLKLAFKTWD